MVQLPPWVQHLTKAAFTLREVYTHIVHIMSMNGLCYATKCVVQRVMLERMLFVVMKGYGAYCKDLRLIFCEGILLYPVKPWQLLVPAVFAE